MKIEATDLTVKKLLNSKSEVFKVPLYQRPYSWSKDQWNDFWDDLQRIEEDESHFLGSIVVITDNHKKGLNFYEVVDGQQRLTTILLLLTALRDLIEETSSKYINDTFLHSSEMDNTSLKLILGKDDNVVFDKLIDNKPLTDVDKESNVYLAYTFFKDKITNDVTNWRDLYNKLLESLNLVLIITESHYDAFRLFETLNNRGLELSSVDLIKNYLLGKVSQEDENNLALCIELWDTLIKSLDEIDKVKFFRHYLFSSFAGVVTKPKLYDRYQKLIDQNVNDLVSLMEDLAYKGELYRKISESNIGDNKDINLHLLALNKIEASTSYSLLLKVFSHNLEKKQVINIIKSIEVFSLRRSICKISTRDLDRIYNHLAIEAFKQSNPDEYITVYLKERMPEDEDFKRSFANNDFKRDSQTKYILETIEDFLTNNTGEKSINDRKNVHIEHIMPVEINSKNSKKQYGDWVDYLGDEKKYHKDFVNKIGNLTLLGSSLNIISSNNPFDEKKKNYEKSNITLTKELCKYHKWHINEIKKRSHTLADLAVKIWNI